MQIIKDGDVVYNSIDNAGTSDNAALGARYAKGRLDTLESTFDNYYDKTEVLDLLEQKSAAQFVDQLPATLADNTWYYSKKYADGPDVPNDKRALYAKDSGGVTQYLGVVGDVDLTDYQTKTDNTLTTTATTVVGGINENKAAIDAAKLDGHLYNYAAGYVDSEVCVFDLTNNGSTSTDLRVAEKRIFVSRMTNPIAGSTITGYVETTEFLVPSGPTIYIEQHFYNEQNGNKNSRIEFSRKGNVTLDNLAQYTNWVATKQASISWNAWVPIEYPRQLIPLNSTSVSGQVGYSITGGNLLLQVSSLICSSTGTVNVATVPSWIPTSIKRGTSEIVYFSVCSTGSSDVSRLLGISSSNLLQIFNPVVSKTYWGEGYFPLGY